MPARGDGSSVLLNLLALVALAGCAVEPSASASAPAASSAASPSPSALTATDQLPSLAPTPFPTTAGSGADGRAWSEPAAMTSSARYGSVQAVAASPERWVAVGGVQDWNEDASGGLHFLWDRGQAWTSTDGLGWAPVPHTAVFDGGSIYGVAWTSRGFIAVGTWKDQRPDPNGQPGSTQVFGWGPAAWLSTDGLNWTVIDVEQDRGSPEDQGRMNALVEIDDRILAVGCLDRDCLFGPAVWVLEDERFRRATGMPPGPPAGAYDVVRAPGGLVAVGTLNASGGAPVRAAAWASPDGEVWDLVDDIEQRDGGIMYAVAGVDGALVAVGYESPPEGPLRPAAWISRDSGTSWQETGVDDFGDLTGMMLRDVVFTGSTIVAVAWIESEPWQAAAWVSIDGARWERIDLPGADAPVIAIADGPGGLVTVGGSVNRVTAWWSPAVAPPP